MSIKDGGFINGLRIWLTQGLRQAQMDLARCHTEPVTLSGVEMRRGWEGFRIIIA